jgi:hypothetical protein
VPFSPNLKYHLGLPLDAYKFFRGAASVVSRSVVTRFLNYTPFLHAESAIELIVATQSHFVA